MRRIGAGGMGVVYEALDRERSARVALKTLQRVDAAAIYRFKQEFRALAHVMHPNLVVLHELVSAGDTWFFTMELVDGVSFLAHVREAEVPLEYQPTTPSLSPPPAAPQDVTQHPAADRRAAAATVDLARLRAALTGVAAGVTALHAAGKLHRDLKPSNVLVTPGGRTVILDFGLASSRGLERWDGSADEQLVGTPAYMSPEQARSQPLGPASDWYCVGVMLYEALTGRLPFSGAPLEVLMAKQAADPPAPSGLVADVPPELDALCMELLRRDPARRPSGGEVLARLKAGGGGDRADESRRRSGAADVEAGATAAAFVGRQRQLLALGAAFEACGRGRPVAVFVQGPSGMGKTALVARFLDELRRRDAAVVLSGPCYERESVPYKALDSLVDELSRHLRRLPRAQAEALVPRDVHALGRLFPVLRRVEAIDAAPRRAFEIQDPQEVRRRAFAGLKELLARMADRRQLVLHIDDVQWGDADSAALLLELLGPPDPPALLVVLGYRSEEAAASALLRALDVLRASGEARSNVDVRELELGPLDETEARDLARTLLGAGADPAVLARADAIARESQGSPLFVGELVRHAAAAGGEMGVHDVLRERLGRLPEAARRLLELVAVAGRPIDQGTALEAAGVGDDAPSAIAALRGASLVRARGTSPDDSIETFHDRIRQTVVSTLDEHGRRRHHRRLADALEASGRADPEVLAEHFEGGGEPGRAADYAARAAEQAAEALAFDAAARLFRRALDLTTLDPPRARALRTRRAHALANAGRGAEAAADYLAAASDAPADEVLELQRRAGEQLILSGHFDRGLEVLHAVLASTGIRLPKTPRRALWSLLFGRARLYLRGFGFEHHAETDVSPEELRRIDLSWSVALGLSMVGLVRGADFQTRNLLLALRAGEPARLARAMAAEAAFASSAGPRGMRRTRRFLGLAEELAQESGDPYAAGMCALAGGISCFIEGRWRKAVDLCDRAERVFRERCTATAWEVTNVNRAGFAALFFLGELDELGRRVQHAMRESQDRGDLYAAANCRIGLPNSTWLAADDPDAARRHADEALQLWTQLGVPHGTLWGTITYAQIDLYEGDAETALGRMTAEQWKAFARSMLPRAQPERVAARYWRGRANLAVAVRRDGAERDALLAVVDGDAARVDRERTEWCEPIARLLRAGAAAVRGDAHAAAVQLATAVDGFERADMTIFAAVARRRRGELVGGDEGRALRADADAAMARQRIQRPARWTAMLAPGFPDAG